MSTSLDAFQAGLEKLLPGHFKHYQSFHPSIDAVFTAQNRQKINEYMVKWTSTEAGVGAWTTLKTGHEKLQTALNESSKRYRQYFNRSIYTWVIDDKRFADVNGPADMENLLHTYGDRAAWDATETVCMALMVGGISEMGGLFTFNGDQSYNPDDQGAEQGALMFVTKAAQEALGASGALHGQNRSYWWSNGYGHSVSGFEGDGLRKLRQVHDDTAAQGNRKSRVDLMFADPDSYDSYVDAFTPVIRYIGDHGKLIAEGDPVPANIAQEFIMFKGAKMYRESWLDRANTTRFTTAACADGIVMGINSSGVKMGTKGSVESGEGDLTYKKGAQAFAQEVRAHHIVFHGQFWTPELSTHYTFTGGANDVIE